LSTITHLRATVRSGKKNIRRLVSSAVAGLSPVRNGIHAAGLGTASPAIL
jgi:hypothetical protein